MFMDNFCPSPTQTLHLLAAFIYGLCSQSSASWPRLQVRGPDGCWERQQACWEPRRWAWFPWGPLACFMQARQWPEVYDLCYTFLHVARVKKPAAMRESLAVGLRVSHGRRFFDSRNMQKRAKKSYTSGHCLMQARWISALWFGQLAKSLRPLLAFRMCSTKSSKSVISWIFFLFHQKAINLEQCSICNFTIIGRVVR